LANPSDLPPRPASAASPGDPASGGDLDTESRYDTLGDLFQTVLPEGNKIENVYDAAGHLEAVKRIDASIVELERVEYDLDDGGNRTFERQFPGGSQTADSVTEFIYTSPCKLDMIKRGASPDPISVTEFDYDCNGNLTAVWDAETPSNNKTAPATSPRSRSPAGPTTPSVR